MIEKEKSSRSERGDNFAEQDTISAVSTALGQGAVGIVRLSGPRALAVAEKLFRAPGGKTLQNFPPRRLTYGHISDTDGTAVDEVLAVYMAAPRSYTGEDVVEFQCHGGREALRKILALTYGAGARPAEPGEFTKRAFLNGRIDLTQAEAVLASIAARSEAALKMAARQQKGELAAAIKSWRRQLLDLIVNLEATIDYPEDDIEEVTYRQAGRVVAEVKQGLEELLSRARSGRIVQEGLPIAIIGRPNVGKSSLLNALLREERAIVSPIAGTTRDTIKEQLLLAGVPLILADTAGIRTTGDKVEQLGVERSLAALEQAQLVLCVLDAQCELSDEDKEVLAASKDKARFIILNKEDLPPVLKIDEIKALYLAEAVLAFSALTGSGMEALEQALLAYVFGQEGRLSEGVYIQNERQENKVRQACVALSEAKAAIEAQLPYDCIEVDLKEAAASLGAVSGESVRAEVIDEIFARFCVGK